MIVSKSWAKRRPRPPRGRRRPGRSTAASPRGSDVMHRRTHGACSAMNTVGFSRTAASSSITDTSGTTYRGTCGRRRRGVQVSGTRACPAVGGTPGVISSRCGTSARTRSQQSPAASSSNPIGMPSAPTEQRRDGRVRGRLSVSAAVRTVNDETGAIDPISCVGLLPTPAPGDDLHRRALVLKALDWFDDRPELGVATMQNRLSVRGVTGTGRRRHSRDTTGSAKPLSASAGHSQSSNDDDQGGDAGSQQDRAGRGRSASRAART